MSTYLRLTKIGFDNLENSDASFIVYIKYFAEDKEKGLSAHGVASEYIYTLNEKMYLGWDGEIYPQFKLETIYMEKNKEI